MNSDGEIFYNPTKEQIRKQKLVEISEEEVLKSEGMNKHERRKLYEEKRQERKKKGPFGKKYF